MEAGLDRALIAAYGEILTLLKTDEDRMEKLEEFDEAVAVDIPDWEEKMKEYVSDKKNAEECIRAIEAFHAKYHVVDENGNRVYERIRMGNGLHQIVITYDANAEGKDKLTIREVPDIESMDLDDLQKYYETVTARYCELEDEEPSDAESEESEEYRKWEKLYEEIEELKEEVEERIEELGGEV